MSQSTAITALAYELAETYAISVLEGHSSGRSLANVAPGEEIEITVMQDDLPDVRKALQFLGWIRWLSFTEHPQIAGRWSTFQIIRTPETAPVPVSKPYEPDGL